MQAIPDHLLEYRKVLVAAEQKAQEDFDKTVLTLSGGALGISFVFLKDVIGTNPVEMPMLLIGAWVAWGFSSLAVLLSYHLGVLTIGHCIKQIDNCIQGEFGGPYATWTKRLNGAGAVLFFVGVVLITVFAGANFSMKGDSHAKPQNAPTAAASGPSTRPPTR